MKSNGVEIKVDFASLEIKANGDYATATIKLKTPIKKGIDFGFGLRFTASTQSGPYPTYNNNNGDLRNRARKAEYILGPDFYWDCFR